jgi:hypothetical protein
MSNAILKYKKKQNYSPLVLFWNCCGGLSSKFESVKLIIKKYDPEAFFLSEAEYKHGMDYLNIEGYNIVTANTINEGLARSVCYIHQRSKFKDVTNVVLDKPCDIIVLESKEERIVGVYKPFKLKLNQTRAQADESFFRSLEACSRTDKAIWIGGDFNINLRKKTSDSKKLQLWQDDNSLKQLVSTWTWSRIHTDTKGKRELRKSLIDHLYTNSETTTIKIGDNWTSDHRIITIKLPEREKIERKKCITRDWKKYSASGLCEEISNHTSKLTDAENWTSDYLNDSIVAIIKTSFDKVCPERVVRTSRDSDIVSNNIEKLKKKRKRKMKAYNKNPTEFVLETIKKLDKKIKANINKVGRDLVQKKMMAANTKSFWSTVRQLQGEAKSKHRDTIILKIDDCMIKDETVIADNIARFFKGKVENLSNTVGPYEWVRTGHSLSVTQKELEDARKSLKSKMCSGHDGIPLKILRDAVPAISDELLLLMRKACDSIPMSWKKSIIVPLHKGGDKTAIENYRPISNLVSISKLFEKIILNKLDASYPGIEGVHQHGFRRGRSTVTALLELQHHISSNLDKNMHVSTYSIDMSAAFDLLRPDVFHGL